MILPLLEYCDVTWHGCVKENSLKIERMQRRACRIVLPNCKELPSEEIINILGWKSLEERQVKSLMAKCIEGNVPDLSNDYFRVKCCNIHH